MIPAAAPMIGEEEFGAVDRVLRSGMLAQGPEVAAFETEFSNEVVAGSHCVAVNSGTSALHLMLLAAGVGQGDEVLVPSFTFAATANAVVLTGATPVFVDIDPDFFCMDPSAAAAAITPRTRAILPVHLYGHPADVIALKSICDGGGLQLFEDAAQAHLAAVRGRPVATFGDAGAFSFYPTKNMTTGEGGMVVTSSSEIAKRVRLLRNQGQERRYENEIVGLNNRMSDIHAAIGRVQLPKLAGWTAIRRKHAAIYDRDLKGVVVPPVAPYASHAYHQYTVRIGEGDRDDFAAHLAARGVGSGVYYPIPVHRLPAFAQSGDLPETERAARECLSLPVHPALTMDQIETVVQTVNDIASAGA